MGWFQQPCHADADRCGGGHLWLRLSCSFSLMRSNRRIKADIIGPNAQSGRFPAMSAGPAHPTRLRFGVPKLSERSSHVMPAWICAVAGIYGCGILESALLNIKPDIAYRGEVGSSFDSVESSISGLCVYVSVIPPPSVPQSHVLAHT